MRLLRFGLASGLALDLLGAMALAISPGLLASSLEPANPEAVFYSRLVAVGLLASAALHTFAYYDPRRHALVISVLGWGRLAAAGLLLGSMRQLSWAAALFGIVAVALIALARGRLA